MQQRTALRMAILLSCCLLLAACGGLKDSVVPAAASVQAPAARQIYIVVQRGQTLDKFAEKFHIAKAEIIALNNLKPPYVLKPGAVLQIPALPSTPEPEEQTVEPLTRPTPASAAVAAPKPPPLCCGCGPSTIGQTEASAETEEFAARGDPARLTAWFRSRRCRT